MFFFLTACYSDQFNNKQFWTMINKGQLFKKESGRTLNKTKYAFLMQFKKKR